MSKRSQDWLYVVLGCWLVVSPWVLGEALNKIAASNSIGIGAVLVVFNVISISSMFGVGQVIFNIVLGCWLILSPYPLDFVMDKAPTVNVITVGALIIAFAGWQIDNITTSTK